MPYLTIADIGGDRDRLLDAYRSTAPVMDGVGRDHGLILHAAAPTDEGLLVVNLWPSRRESEAAGTDPRRQASLRAAAVDPARQRREHYELERYVLLA